LKSAPVTNRYAGRGYLRSNSYDVRRAAGKTLSASLVRWIARFVIMPSHPRVLEALTNAGCRPRLTALKAYLQGLRATYRFHLLNYNTVAAFEGHTWYFYDGAHPTVENSRILLRHAVKAAPESFR
jgi:hypothetical protein